ncbi:GspJ family T2SS minor pseudopilin variant LspJ [Legionella sp. W05-934-2]|jgi:general secretion pathway protein J|uniref:GspJ family T2SS minor pseudopilin variant LspJ n=1 Tax=Legionella sp. W05-934-2 TaxID=1198649 RepID=UPI003463662D
MIRLKGFTLIEILVALVIFAVIASITSATLYHAFNAREKVNLMADKLNQLEIAMALLQQDSYQAIPRSVRGNDLRYFPVFVGQGNYIEFTRSGLLNPKQQEHSSSMQRVAYRCDNGKLYRKRWLELDTTNRNRFHEKAILSNLSSCRFEYINRTLDTLNEWRPQRSIRERLLKPELLPKAIRVHLKFKDWGEMQPLFIIPEAAYANLLSK